MTTILHIKLRCLSRNETTALTYLSQGRETASCHIQRRCMHPDAQTTRRLLKRLEREGLVAGVKGRSGRVYWWRITDAGRAAIAEAA
ncbi:hypothetical protein [Bosea vestrisii]|uniref:Uncharacterized protein n=1 Tax=Bosea vestrisii TaxID=151416 RepID=A0ABW0H932_9HYPH